MSGRGRSGSLPTGPGPGTLRVADRVVEKIAAAAAAEVVGVAGPPRRGPGHGRGRRGRAARPRVAAKVGGGTARLTMSLSVRYPTPVAETAEQVRGVVRERVAALAGVRVTRIDIDVPALPTDVGAG